jgi:hypothetical protein
MTRRRIFWKTVCGAGAAALAVAPAFSAPRIEWDGVVRAALCAEDGRRTIDIDFGGDEPPERSRHSPCHAVFMADRKAAKSRDGR